MLFHAAEVLDFKQSFHGFTITYSSRFEHKHSSFSFTCSKWTLHLLAWIYVTACLVCPRVTISELMTGFC